jgi:hypothetical protein
VTGRGRATLVTAMVVPGSVMTVTDAPDAKMPLKKVPLTSIVPLAHERITVLASCASKQATDTVRNG